MKLGTAVYNIFWFTGCAFIVCYGPAVVNYAASYADAISKVPYPLPPHHLLYLPNTKIKHEMQT